MASSSLLVPALIFITVGFLAGVLVMIVVGDIRRRREEKEKGGSPMDDLIVPEMPALPESRFESVANLYREKRTGKVVTDIKGKVHINRGTIPSDQLKALQEFARSWHTWLGIPPQAAQAVKPPDVEPQPVNPPAPVLAEAATAPQEGAPIAATDLPEAAKEDELPVLQPAANMPVMEPIVPASVTPEPPPVLRTGQLEKPKPSSLVAQINDVLQEMLPETKFAGQNILISEEPVNGVVVWVGAQKYFGVDNVADPEIKAVIQSAIRRWENQTGRS